MSIDLKKHHAPTNWMDKMAYWSVKSLRWPTDLFFQVPVSCLCLLLICLLLFLFFLFFYLEFNFLLNETELFVFYEKNKRINNIVVSCKFLIGCVGGRFHQLFSLSLKKTI